MLRTALQPTVHNGCGGRRRSSKPTADGQRWTTCPSAADCGHRTGIYRGESPTAQRDLSSSTAGHSGHNSARASSRRGPVTSAGGTANAASSAGCAANASASDVHRTTGTDCDPSIGGYGWNLLGKKASQTHCGFYKLMINQ